MALPVIDIFPHKSETTALPELLSEESFEAHVSKYADLPWLQEIKRHAWEQFKALPMPTRTHEHWRFANLQDFNVDGFHLSQAPAEHEQEDIIRASNFVQHYAGRLVFEDNHVLAHDYVPESLETQGVIWEPLSEAFEKHPELVQLYFAKSVTRLGSDKFYHLNTAYAHTGYFLFVPKNVQIDQPFVAYHWANATNAALFPQSVIILEEGAKASVVDVFNSHSQKSSGLAIANACSIVNANAELSRNTIQNWNENTTSFQLDSQHVERDGRAKSVAINLGSQRARFENQLHLNGPNADAKAYSLTIAGDSQEFDQRTFQAHHAPNTTSDLLYKNALADKSKTIFSGMIRVDQEAQQTDAYQTNRNLMLSDKADANSLPGLEIEANDVKCSHGATSGKLDESNLFYMLSRGLTPALARELLTLGFFEEIIQKVDNDELLPHIQDLIQKKFHGRIG